MIIDKRKVRLMTRAAIYEKRYGEEDIKITGYYQKRLFESEYVDHADLGNGRFFPSGCPYVPGRGGRV